MRASHRDDVHSRYPASDYTLELLAAQVGLLFRQTPSAFVATLFNAAVLGFVLWGQVSDVHLIGWLVAVGLLTLVRHRLVRAYYRANPPAAESVRWGRRFVFGTLLSGLLWGTAGGLFFVEQSLLH